MPGVWVFPGGVVDFDEDGDGRPRTAGAEAPGVAAPAADPEELAHRACAIRELREETGITLPDDAELRPWSRWVTPEPSEIRFDTRFYVALAPPHAPPKADGVEMVDAGWFAPQHALDMHSAGDFGLVFPTIKHLEELATFATADDVMAAAINRHIEPVMPRIRGTGDDRREVLPYLPERG